MSAAISPQIYSWRWIFLINILPGLLVSWWCGFACGWAGRPDVLQQTRLCHLGPGGDLPGQPQLLLNEAPGRDWRGAFVFSTAGVCVICCRVGAWRALTHATPFIDLYRFRHRSFAIGCGLCFVLGMGLYGSSYMLALFLGLVRGHTPLVIGEFMVVSGAAQLLMAPVAALPERW